MATFPSRPPAGYASTAAPMVMLAAVATGPAPFSPLQAATMITTTDASPPAVAAQAAGAPTGTEATRLLPEGMAGNQTGNSEPENPPSEHNTGGKEAPLGPKPSHTKQQSAEPSRPKLIWVRDNPHVFSPPRTLLMTPETNERLTTEPGRKVTNPFSAELYLPSVATPL